MTEAWLVRATLRRDAAAASIARLLVPEDPDARMGAAHRLIWSLFADLPDRKRDFLWRETAPGAYLALASRRPVDAHGLFHLECKPFAPALRAGQRLGFSLRANPVIAASPEAGRRRGKRHDVAMHALHKPAPGARVDRREQLLHDATLAWLVRQGGLHGFDPDPARVRIDGHDQVRLPRGVGVKPIRFSVMTLEGVLTVRDPAAFETRLRHGFGAAKAFGCGLMLIRPAPVAADPGGEDELG